MIPDVCTLDEAANYLRIKPELLKRLARARKIGYLKQGLKLTFPRAALEAYVEANAIQALPPNAFGLTERSAARLRSTG